MSNDRQQAVEESKAIVQAAALVLIDAALNLIQSDPHQWSGRPCATCRAVTTIAGRPFGCYAYHKKVQGA